MTAQTKGALKLKFEQGDRPQGSDYEDLIDSYLNTQDTSVQSINSTLVVPKLGATTVTANAVSAQSVSVSGALITDLQAINAGLTNASAQSVNTSALTVRGDASVSGKLSVSGDITVSGHAALGALTVIGRASAAEYITFSSDTSVAAVSTTQASGKPLGAKQFHFIQACVTAANDSVVLLGAYPGLYQQVWNLTSQSGRAYPMVGGSINSAADNAAYDLHPKTCTHITHMTSTKIMAARSSM
jgi:hypothetical protein